MSQRQANSIRAVAAGVRDIITELDGHEHLQKLANRLGEIHDLIDIAAQRLWES